ncbi:hypothetical protein AGMMS49592_2640 [Endomicrobiia bacterium]|nr:hypothetical protein AGMMS49592_2640 [Endomicrobiia bacterium]
MSVKVVDIDMGYSDILLQETITMSAKVVDIDIGYVEEVLMSSGEYADGNRYY